MKISTVYLSFITISPIRRKELKDMASEIEVEFKQFGLLKNIRWLASRSRALQISEHNYLAIVYDLKSKSYGTDETANKATHSTQAKQCN